METIMRYLVVYDTSYGNTAKVAEAIRTGLGAGAQANEVETLHPEDLSGLDLLVVGSPTQGGRPTQSMADWLGRLPSAPQGASVTVFDTRLASEDVGLGLRLLMNVIGYAASRIAKALVAKGYILVGDPKGFIVTGKEGPLAAGELDRARNWGADLARQFGDVHVAHA
jgi:flavodoxin